MANNSVCYFPDGKTTLSSPDSNYVPCDPSASHSPCCVQGETCIGMGLCFSGTGLIYRGACTDKNYRDGACPNTCTELSGRNAGRQSSFDFILPCAIEAPGTVSGWTRKWVCGFDTGCGNSSKLFNMIPGAVRQVNITGNYSPSSSSSISSSASTPTGIGSSPSTSSASTTMPTNDLQADCLSKTAVVGAGIGIPFGLLALLAIIFALWQRRIAKTQQQQFARDLRSLKEKSPSEIQELYGKAVYTAAYELRAAERTNELP